MLKAKGGNRAGAAIERTFDTVNAFIESVIRHETTSGVVLLISTALALLIMNSGLSSAYLNFINTVIGVNIGGWGLTEPLKLWVNDGLMAIFFLMVGLEIKREVLIGELATPKKALLPIIAAIGGMVMPAFIYFMFNPGPPELYGWGIPMATDIAFAMGILAAAGKKAPRSLYVFLIALAIVDDLGAVMVIAIFYTKYLAAEYLGAAMLVWALMFILNLGGVKSLLPYYVLAIFVWFAMLHSGIHATLAGVMTAMAIPLSGKLPESSLDLCELSHGQDRTEKHHTVNNSGKTLMEAKKRIFLVESPVDRALADLHLPVAYIVMPVFAFVNAGIPLSLELAGKIFTHPVAHGVILGLCIGKFAGITLSSLAAVKLGAARLPDGMSVAHLAGGGLIGGVGFTMSIFIAALGFRNEPELLLTAKTAILFGSTLSAILGFATLSLVSSRRRGG
ncbi:MAG: Na+/H+ antiporter NhaA [Nitrospinae bacterium]|nr:Na+/H+ antiporter NhaA [Nitrospinota bacterium]